MMTVTQSLPNARFQFTPCFVCGNEDLSTYLAVRYGDLKQKSSLDYSSLGVTAETAFSVMRCGKCGLVFVSPRLKPEFERAVYNECKSSQGARKLDTSSGEFKVMARRRKLKYVGSLMEMLSWMDAERADLTLFDFGCGFGHSMSLAREFGVDAYGVDVDRERLRICRELDLKVAEPESFEAEFPGVKADLILWQSNIEHLLDPRSGAEYLKALAKPGGVLHVNGITPELISIERRKGQYVKAHFVEHINYFPIATLDRFLGDYGFKPLPFRHHFAINGARDLLNCVGAWFVFGVLGRGSWRGYFKRLYRFTG